MSDPTAAEAAADSVSPCMAVDTHNPPRDRHILCTRPAGHVGDHVHDGRGAGKWSWPNHAGTTDPRVVDHAAAEMRRHVDPTVVADDEIRAWTYVVLDAAGVDADSPRSLLRWHTDHVIRESLARQVEDRVPDLSDDPHTAGYAAALLDVLLLIDPDRSTR